MKKLLLSLLLIPLLASAQDFEYIGIRAAYTHSNKSHNLGFLGISLNSFDDGSGSAGGGWDSSLPTGTTLYAGAHISSHANMPSKVQIIPEIGTETSLTPLAIGFSVNTHCIHPRIGLSGANLLGTYIGYSIPFREQTAFEGFTLSVVLNLFNPD